MNVANVAPYSRVVCPSCQTENRVKKQFGPYILTRRHAIGGMSSVFIAYDETLGREVALKILSEEYSADEKRIEAFEQEARLTASFSHPNVVRVLTTGRAFGRFYIAMEFVPGGHFEHQIREKGRLPELEVLPLAIQVAEGLKGAQAAGLIHRDVKPGNILLDSGGNAKLVDFGLALVTKGGKATATEIWATPYYVPPEAIEGGAEDFRSDIYAFGATFYHALAGKPPCDEESMATKLLMEAKKRVVPLKRVAPDLSDETCAVIDRAMAYEPDHRFASYDEMISGLRTALLVARGEKTGEVDAVSKTQRRLMLRREKQRRNFLIGAAVMLCVAGGLALIAANAGKQPVAKPQPGNVIVGNATEDSGDDPVEIAHRYQSARRAMQDGDFLRAEQRFAALLGDAAVQEPTRTWAGLQAIVAAMMDGRMRDARKQAENAENHLSSGNTTGGDGFHKGVVPVLIGIRDLGFLDAEKLDLGSGGNERYMGYLIAGLKNWEQGGMDQAVPFFRKIESERSLTGDEVMGWYQQAVRTYLKDYGILKSEGFDVMPKTPEECREASEELNRVLSLLRTKGRARFNIHARQLDLEKLGRQLEKSVSPEGNSLNVMEEIAPLVKRYRFDEAAKILEKEGSDPPGGKRSSVLLMAKSATVFLSDIRKELRDIPFNIPLKLRDGADVSSLVVKDGDLKAKLSDGDVRDIKLLDLPADQILALHKAMDDPAADDAELLRRSGSAIAFDWLAGDRKRAVLAAKSLSEKSENFRELWDAVSQGLPE